MSAVASSDLGNAAEQTIDAVQLKTMKGPDGYKVFLVSDFPRKPSESHPARCGDMAGWQP